MSQKILNGNDIKYSLIFVTNDDIERLKVLEKKYKDIIGYGIINDNGYSFYSIKDNYYHSILNHWTVDIINNYDNYKFWVLVKKHPCNLYSIMTNICKPSNYVFNVNNFDIWKNYGEDYLIAVITDIEID
jgi:hypothetical protein